MCLWNRSPDESGCYTHGLITDLKYSTNTIVKYDVETRHCFVFTIMRGFGNQYDPLSSGSLLYSGNARPITKLAVSSNYIPVPFSRGLIEFKGYLSHGWFEEDRYTASPYLHLKNVYLRVGGDLPIHAHFGFHHYAIWGGTSPEHGNLPNGWDTYKKIFFTRIQIMYL